MDIFGYSVFQWMLVHIGFNNMRKFKKRFRFIFYRALLCGEHHKKAKSKLILVRWYYEKYWFFALHCIGAEVYKNYLNLIYFLKVFVVVSYIVYYVEAFYCFHALKREL